MRIFRSNRLREDLFVLSTDRLFLRVVRPEADVSVADYLVRNRVFHAPFHQYQPDRYFTREEQRQYILSDIRAFERGERYPFWISTKAEPERVIGRLSFSNVIRGALLSCHAGYHMDQGELRKGYMKEALSAGCEYMFSELRLHRIQADVMPHNLASIQTVESCGFRRQGLNEQYMCIAGKWQDHLCFAKINDESGRENLVL